MWNRLALLGLVTSVSACTAPATPQQTEVGAVEGAISLIECQTQAAECLGLFPTASEIDSCREAFEKCVGDVAGERAAQASTLDMCAQTGRECALNAKSFEDAAMCRSTFEACTNGIVSPPDLPPVPTVDLPEISDTAKCRDMTLTCVQSATSAANVQACGVSFRDCLSAELPNVPRVPTGTPPTLPTQPSLDAVRACRDDALTCVGATADTAGTASCATMFRECIAATL